tara:strand:+ start:211240 stop:211383 length:144 start_codon:yes stop_codon:yes gene_type:complete
MKYKLVPYKDYKIAKFSLILLSAIVLLRAIPFGFGALYALIENYFIK